VQDDAGDQKDEDDDVEIQAPAASKQLYKVDKAGYVGYSRRSRWSVNSKPLGKFWWKCLVRASALQCLHPGLTLLQPTVG
jgi:hypothetical protein